MLGSTQSICVRTTWKNYVGLLVYKFKWIDYKTIKLPQNNSRIVFQLFFFFLNKLNKFSGINSKPLKTWGGKHVTTRFCFNFITVHILKGLRVSKWKAFYNHFHLNYPFDNYRYLSRVIQVLLKAAKGKLISTVNFWCRVS